MIIPAKDWNRSVYQLSKQCFIGMMITANRWNRLFAWALNIVILFLVISDISCEIYNSKRKTDDNFSSPTNDILQDNNFELLICIFERQIWLYLSHWNYSNDDTLHHSIHFKIWANGYPWGNCICLWPLYHCQ